MSNAASLGKRYAYKLLTNIVGAGFSLVALCVVPRGLGPSLYGDYNFLINFFNQIVGFVDMGTSVCFYTKLSQRQKEGGLVVFYSYFMFVVALAMVVFIICAQWSGAYKRIWPGQGLMFVYLSAGLVFLIWVVQTLNKMTDAYGITVSAEKAKMLQRIVGAVLVAIIYYVGQLHLVQYFLFSYVIWFGLAVSFLWIVIKHGGARFRNELFLPTVEVKKYVKEFYKYSHPLIAYAIVALVIGIFDRWILQVYAGSVEQGFFGLSYQIGAACFLFTSAMTQLLTREFSIAHGNGDIKHMAFLFRRYIPLLYSVAALFSCFVAVNAGKIIDIMGGAQYKGAVIAVAIMAFYPIHQTYGQLSGSVFYAAGKTALYRNIGVMVMLIGLPISYVLIAPHDKFGMNAGATGLAIKMVLLQFIAVNVQMYFNAKMLELSLWRYIAHQFVSVFCFLAIAVATSIGVVSIFSSSIGNIAEMFISGILYVLIVVALIYIFPVVVGLKRADIKKVSVMCLGVIRPGNA